MYNSVIEITYRLFSIWTLIFLMMLVFSTFTSITAQSNQPPVLTLEAGNGIKAELSEYSLTNYSQTNGVYSGKFCFSLKNTSERLPSQVPIFLVGIGFDNSSGVNHRYRATEFGFPNGFFQPHPQHVIPLDFRDLYLLFTSKDLANTSNEFSYPGNGIKPGETLSFCMTLTDEIPFTLNDLTREFNVLFFDGLPAGSYVYGSGRSNDDELAQLHIKDLSADRMCFSVKNCKLQKVTGIGFDLPGNRGLFELVSAAPLSNDNQLFRFTTAPFRLRYLNGETSGKLDFGFLTSRIFTKGLPQFGISMGNSSNNFCVSGDFSGLEPRDILRAANIRFESSSGRVPPNSFGFGGGFCPAPQSAIRRVVRSNPR